MLGETHTFSPTLINEFSFAFNWGNDQNLQYNDNSNISATLGLNGVPFNAGPLNGGLPAVSTGWQAFGAHGNDPAHEGQNNYQILDNVTKIIQQPLAEDGLPGNADALLRYRRRHPARDATATRARIPASTG